MAIVTREPAGSNGFVIAPSHSASGHPLLLINPHTSFFFRAELHVTSGQGLNTYGAATWGQFFIYQGFNQNAGWMHTTSSADTVDEFAQTVDKVTGGDGWTYRYGKEQRPVTIKTVVLAYRKPDGTMGSRVFNTFATHHGPVVREAEGKWISAALMHRPVAALQQSFLRTKVKDLAGFRRVAQLQANSTNNTLFASNIGRNSVCSCRNSCRGAIHASTTPSRSTVATRQPTGTGCTRFMICRKWSARPTAGR